MGTYFCKDEWLHVFQIRTEMCTVRIEILTIKTADLEVVFLTWGFILDRKSIA